ncbi:MAG: hypothetical protein J5836_03560 [Clostridia bacterium]|nr:hypothetical protein [Clostridia bacterium]
MYYNSRQTNVLEREEVKTEDCFDNDTVDFGGGFSNDGETVMTKKKYESPALNYIKVAGYDRRTALNQRFQPQEEEADENITPSKTTMQFVNMEKADVYEAVRKSESEDGDKRFRINTRSKILIAVYAIAVITIFSLIVLNAAMLKNVDKTINSSVEKIEVLRGENATLNDKLDYVRSDDVVISEAEKRGLN